MKIFGLIASAYGMLGVALGAFGAHALKEKLNDYQHIIFEKAVFYQFVHALVLLVVFLLAQHIKNQYLQISAYCFAFGILFFSGSLYLLACKDLLHLGNLTKIIGPITPIGGLLFIIGWIMLFLTILKS
ncbi:MAG: DUF423 domain-containing protein [Chitinophagales bacterium]|nr:DUF423 domain-containing protein [Chitinophagales bacterium]